MSVRVPGVLRSFSLLTERVRFFEIA